MCKNNSQTSSKEEIFSKKKRFQPNQTVKKHFYNKYQPNKKKEKKGKEITIKLYPYLKCIC